MTSLALGAGVLALAAAMPASAAGVSACLITKTDTNPFFVKMKEGASAKASELGVTLKAYAGKIDGDNESQVAAIESCIADGAKGILLVPSDSKAIVDSVKKARDAGILVIALDTPLDPIDSADSTFATDNFKAGELIGAWAKAQLGDAAKDAKIAYLDLNPSQPTVDVSARPGLHERLRHRHQGRQQDRRRGRSAQRLPRRDQRQRGRRPQGDGKLPDQRSRASTSSTPSTNRRRPAPMKR